MALEQLLQALERDGAEQARAILEAARAEAARRLDEARNRCERRRAEQIAGLEAESAAALRAETIAARRRCTTRAQTTRHALIDRVFEAAAARLGEAMTGAAWRAALAGDLSEALSYIGRRPAAVICPARLAPEIRAALGARDEIVVRPGDDTMTGIIVETLDGGLVVDQTLGARLARMRPLLEIEIARHLEAAS